MVGVTPKGTDVVTAPANHSPLFYLDETAHSAGDAGDRPPSPSTTSCRGHDDGNDCRGPARAATREWSRRFVRPAASTPCARASSRCAASSSTCSSRSPASTASWCAVFETCMARPGSAHRRVSGRTPKGVSRPRAPVPDLQRGVLRGRIAGAAARSSSRRSTRICTRNPGACSRPRLVAGPAGGPAHHAGGLCAGVRPGRSRSRRDR